MIEHTATRIIKVAVCSIITLMEHSL